MTKLQTTQEKVKAILTSHTESRDDDMKLYLYVCNYCLPFVGGMPLEVVMTQYHSLGIPCFESVRRTRQKLQAQHPELSSSKRIKKLRMEQEKYYSQYAKDA